MKKQISLRLFITLTFIVLIGIFVVCYSVLSTYFHIRQLHQVTYSNMEKAAEIYLKVVPEEKRRRVKEFGEYFITDTWEKLPAVLQRVFADRATGEDFLVEVEEDGWFSPPRALYFLYRFQDGDREYYMTKEVSKPAKLSDTGKNFPESRHLFFILTGLIVVSLAIVILLIIRKVFRPITALNQWTRTLDKKSLENPPPDFSYPELNELAGLIQTSLSSVQESLTREHRFLRYASHELRTPIAIIQNNIELLHKLEEKNKPDQQPMKTKVIDRISRAGFNMQHLTETLLWLSKKETGSLPAQEVELESLTHELVEEMKYLLERKDVSLEIATAPFHLTLPEFPLRIVLGNLIRNAFQHTWEGKISIEQKENRITVSNTLTASGKDDNDLGFGLGLQLTSQLADKLGWPYTNETLHDMNRAEIVLLENVINPEKEL